MRTTQYNFQIKPPPPQYPQNYYFLPPQYYYFQIILFLPRSFSRMNSDYSKLKKARVIDIDPCLN